MGTDLIISRGEDGSPLTVKTPEDKVIFKIGKGFTELSDLQKVNILKDVQKWINQELNEIEKRQWEI